MPKQLLSAMDLPEAARAAVRIAVDSDSPQPILFAVQLLVDACLSSIDELPEWRNAKFAIGQGLPGPGRAS
jgi:hypothetical protein